MLRYHSTPKPVRIRIESGGEEHFSLDSLLGCFNPEDIIMRKQELLRWLGTQGERGKQIKSRLLEIEFCRKNIYRIYKAFFPETEAQKLVELYAAWHDSKQYMKNFHFLRAFCLSDGKTIEQLYSAKETRGLEKDWLGIIQTFVQERYIDVNSPSEIPFMKKIDHPMLFYYLGCLYYEQENSNNKALMYLKFATKPGDEAVEKRVKRYLKNHTELLLQDLVNFCCQNYRRFNNNAGVAIHSYFNENNTVNPYCNSSAITAIVKFVLDCCEIKTYSPNDRLHQDKKVLSSRANRAKALFQEHPSPLHKLMLFVLYILQCDVCEDNTIKNTKCLLKLSVNDYVPAKYIIYHSSKDAFLDENCFRELSSIEKIDFILEHIIFFLPNTIKEKLSTETKNAKDSD